MFSIPKRNTGKSFERLAKIFRGLQRFGENLRGVAAVGVHTVQFQSTDGGIYRTSTDNTVAKGGNVLFQCWLGKIYSC